MKNTISHKAFTLIELIVSITIFGIIMISVMSIFIFSSQMSQRVELNRLMQENIKSVVEDIAEELRKGEILDVSSTTLHDCGLSFNSWDVGNKLCFIGGIEYALWYKNTLSSKWERVSDMSSCSDFEENEESICRVIKNEWGGNYFPLTNSFIAIEELSFTITNEKVPKVTIQMTVRPSYAKWLHSEVIENSRLYIQTTVSERLIDMD